MKAINKSVTVYSILFAIAFAHLSNDLIQAVIPALYPKLQHKYGLTLSQIGIITFCFQLSACIFQPLVGSYTDKNPKPYSQIYGMAVTGLGVLLLAYAPDFNWILLSVTLVGVGSSIFHPESSRVAYMAAGGRRSFAQAIFQIGGNCGAAMAPLLVAWLIIPNDQNYILCFLVLIFICQFVLLYIGRWYSHSLKDIVRQKVTNSIHIQLPKYKTRIGLIVLLLLIVSKYSYTSGISSYIQFYMIAKFGITEVQAQLYLFYYLISAAIGTLIGGLFGDRFGRKNVIWFSIVGCAPFTILLPFVGLDMTAILLVLIGFIMASAFPSILVYAQELMPHKIGMISGVFYGFAFGVGGLASAFLGYLADKTSIQYIYTICSYFPLLGLVTFFLPVLKQKKSN